MAPFPIGTFVETFLDQSKDDARRLIRHEIESVLDPLVESLFKQLKDKFVHYLENSSSSGCFNQELILEHNIGVGENLIRDQKTISNAQQMIPSTTTGESLPNTEMPQPQPQQLAHIKHNQFDNEEECDCDECVDGSIEVKEEDDDDDQMDEESSRPMKRPKMDTTQPNNTIHIMQEDDCHYGDGGRTIFDGHCQEINTQFEHSQSTESINSNLNCEENVTVHNLPVESPSYNNDDDENVNLASYEFRELGGYEASNCLLQKELTQPPHAQQMYFEDDLVISQETLDAVKREIDEEKEEEMKRRENEHEGGDERRDEGDRVESELSEAIDTRATIGDHTQDNSDESMVIQQEERDSSNAIGEESIATECTSNPIQPNLAQPNLQCSHCHKSFIHNSALQKHLQVHTAERPFQCGQCDKRFKNSYDLTRHQLIHENMKRFQCDQCDKQFKLKCNLKSHLQTHSGVRPHQCGFCEKSFARLDIKNNHEQAIHLQVKPYRCKQCGHTATQRAQIITHIRGVHFGLPQSIKEQRALNIIDERDPNVLVEKV